MPCVVSSLCCSIYVDLLRYLGHQRTLDNIYAVLKGICNLEYILRRRGRERAYKKKTTVRREGEGGRREERTRKGICCRYSI